MLKFSSWLSCLYEFIYENLVLIFVSICSANVLLLHMWQGADPLQVRIISKSSRLCIEVPSIRKYMYFVMPRFIQSPRVPFGLQIITFIILACLVWLCEWMLCTVYKCLCCLRRRPWRRGDHSARGGPPCPCVVKEVCVWSRKKVKNSHRRVAVPDEEEVYTEKEWSWEVIWELESVVRASFA